MRDKLLSLGQKRGYFWSCGSWRQRSRHDNNKARAARALFFRLLRWAGETPPVIS